MLKSLSQISLGCLFLVLTLVVLKVSKVSATGLSLTRIGTFDVTDDSFTEFTYIGVNPTLAGEATPLSTVSLTIDDSLNTLTADSTGEWSFLPVTLSFGSYDVSIASVSESLDFTLNISSSSALITGPGDGTASASGGIGGATASSTTKGGVSTASGKLPSSGSVGQTALLIGVGGFMVLAAWASRSLLSQPELDLDDLN